MQRIWAIVYLLFQNNYVRIGAVLGTAAGYWGYSWIPGGDPILTPVVGAFLGWGLESTGVKSFRHCKRLALGLSQGFRFIRAVSGAEGV